MLTTQSTEHAISPNYKLSYNRIVKHRNSNSFLVCANPNTDSTSKNLKTVGLFSILWK